MDVPSFYCHSCSRSLPEMSAVCPDCGGTGCNCQSCILAGFSLVAFGSPLQTYRCDGEPSSECSGIERSEEELAPLRAAAAKVADEKVVEVPAIDDQQYPFRALARACGLTTADIELMTGRGSSVRKKSAGKSTMTGSDKEFFEGIWKRILDNDVEGLPTGCQDMAWALRVLGGVR